jgi:TetR/AcrR family transcriptional regulator
MDLKAGPLDLRIPSKKGRKVLPSPNALESILDAAEFVFGHFGVRGASLAVIAQKAGVVKPHIYYYFEDKDDLYRAVLERAMNMWAREIELVDTTEDLPNALVEYINRKVDFSRDHPFLSKIYAMEVISGAPYITGFIEKISTPMLLEKVRTVEEWVKAGVVRPISPYDLFFCIWAMTQAYADFSAQMVLLKGRKPKSSLEEPDYQAAKDTIIQLVLGGLGLPVPEKKAGAR